MDDQFYQQQYFDQLTQRFDSLEDKIDTVNKKVDDIQSKVVYMYGFAAGIGIFASFIIDWFRTHFMGH